MSAPDLKTVPVNFIRFHGLTLLVVENGGVEYVAVKPISDMLGLAWRKVRETVMSGDNVSLYGTKRIFPPSFDVYGGDPEVSGNTETPPDLDEGGAKNRGDKAQMALLYVRLDCARFFLARVNTNQVRIKGNPATADKLLAIQHEWARAIHDYETTGVARKKSVKDDQSLLMQLMKTRELARPMEQPVFTAMIHQHMKEMGFAIGPDLQGSLDLAR